MRRMHSAPVDATSSEVEEDPSNQEGRYPPLDARTSLRSRAFGTYGTRKYTTASIPMATEATKIKTPASTLSPVSM